MTVICVLYVLIGIKLRKSKLLQGIKRKGCDYGKNVSGQTRVIRMLGKYYFYKHIKKFVWGLQTIQNTFIVFAYININI